jgi:hypothetical protein
MKVSIPILKSRSVEVVEVIDRFRKRVASRRDRPREEKSTVESSERYVAKTSVVSWPVSALSSGQHPDSEEYSSSWRGLSLRTPEIQGFSPLAAAVPAMGHRHQPTNVEMLA